MIIIVGARKSFNGREKKSDEEKSRTRVRVGAIISFLTFLSPKFFLPIRTFPAPTNCPWFYEDVIIKDEEDLNGLLKTNLKTEKCYFMCRIYRNKRRAAN